MADLREGWNFHNDIAISLEYDARRILGYRDRPFNTIFDADAIEGVNFAEAMIILLRKKTEYLQENAEVAAFIKECSPYVGMHALDIEPEIAAELYERFTALIK